GMEHRHGQLAQSAKEARQRFPGPPFTWVSGDIGRPRRGKTFFVRVATDPVHAEQHPDQGLDLPARGLMVLEPSLMRLLPELRAEKMRSEERRVGNECRP